MANALEIRPAVAREYLRFGLLLLLALGAPALRAEITADLLIELEPDSRHYLAQNTQDSAEHTPIDPCLDATALDDICAPDSDGDDVPDFRDICLPPSSHVTVLLPPDSSAQQNPGNRQTQSLSEAMGCALADPLRLPGIQFQSGQTYLDVASRNVLNRVARALLRMPEHVFEISSHTDNAGRVNINQRLSEDRAKAVRQYLLLRGVNSEQLKARGYGETSPAYNNAEAVGRRANRRTELRRIN